MLGSVLSTPLNFYIISQLRYVWYRNSKIDQQNNYFEKSQENTQEGLVQKRFKPLATNTAKHQLAPGVFLGPSLTFKRVKSQNSSRWPIRLNNVF